MNEKMNRIREIFPEYKEIEDKKLAQKVIEIWATAWESGKWEDIIDVPKNLQITDIPLVEHVRTVTKCAIEMYKIFEKTYGLKVDYDVLVAASLLHDIDKVVSYKISGDEYVKTKFGKLIPHGYYGMHLALLYELPLEVAHIIITHTHLSPIIPQNIEGLIIHYVDFCESDALNYLHGYKPLLNYC